MGSRVEVPRLRRIAFASANYEPATAGVGWQGLIALSEGSLQGTPLPLAVGAGELRVRRRASLWLLLTPTNRVQRKDAPTIGP